MALTTLKKDTRRFVFQDFFLCLKPLGLNFGHEKYILFKHCKKRANAYIVQKFPVTPAEFVWITDFSVNMEKLQTKIVLLCVIKFRYEWIFSV